MVRNEFSYANPPKREDSNHVQLAGSGLPGGEQQSISSSEVASADDISKPTQLALPSSSTTASSSSALQYSVPMDENNHRYVGLVNQ
uniref:Uncharacterized protein n=1 Tax=Caenorhabditis japonica TaxID=281687 RepID=A0A8R1IRV6_CAEJA